jgi:hypothetical protein
MNNTPVLMYSISMRDNALSRAAVMLTISLASNRLPASLSMRVGRMDIGAQFTSRYPSFNLTTLSVEFPFNPIFTEQLNWVLSSDSSISAAKVISGAQLLAAPANTLRVFWIQRYLELSHT